MNFCSNCDNMLFVKLSQENSNDLVNYCRNCGNEEPPSIENLCVFKNNLKKNDTKYQNYINEYTKLDPTLPRITTIKCPNQDCLSNKEEDKREVISVRYDDSKLKYVYLCATCDYVWKID
jgi:DNA-directed RNA polymerase subunit M/transcription elongation factor TFIIS